MAETADERALRVITQIDESAAGFSKAVQEFAEKLVPEALVLLHKKIALDALAGVVLKTPVDTGRARGGWQTTIGEPAKEETQIKDPVAAGHAVVSGLKPFSIVFLVNNVPYILWLEDGHSKQAPKGMVKLTIEELRQAFP